MALPGNFPAPIMEHFSTINTGVIRAYGGTDASSEYYHWKGNLSEFFALVREMKQSPARKHWERPARCVSESWAGMQDQTISSLFNTSRSTDAQREFNAALARIEKEGKPNSPIFRVTGGVWSVPRYLTGHPECAMYRPRTAKPPLNLDVVACFHSGVKAKDIANPLARIARACWEYQKTGGAATLTVHYCGKFSRPSPGGYKGIIASVRVALSDISSIATACSAPFFRAAFYPFASALSGELGDSIPIAWMAKAGAIRLQGDPIADAGELKKAGIV